MIFGDVKIWKIARNIFFRIIPYEYDGQGRIILLRKEEGISPATSLDVAAFGRIWSIEYVDWEMNQRIWDSYPTSYRQAHPEEAPETSFPRWG